MKHLWIQFSYDDPKNASVLQTAESERQAREDDDIFPGHPWYRHDMANDAEGVTRVSNPDGPYWFTPEIMGTWTDPA